MQSLCLISILILFLKVRDVLEETTMAEDVVLRRVHVMKEKEIVMDLMMVDNMMDIEDVREILCVAPTIVNSSEYIFMRKMTVVSSPCLMKYQHHQIWSTPFQANFLWKHISLLRVIHSDFYTARLFM